MPSADVSVRSLLYRWCSLWELTEENRTRGVRREAPKAARSIGVEGRGIWRGCLPHQPNRKSGGAS